MLLVKFIWLGACLLVGLAWAQRHVVLSRAARENRRLGPGSHPAIGPDAPRLSVLVAAKDEQENIEPCIRTLIDQDYPNYEIIAVNDRSTDRTGQILDRLQADCGELMKVVHVKTLADGWSGKNNAMRLGVARATGQWLCFVDADCRQTSRAALSTAMQEAQLNQIDFLSVLPVLETRSFWERVIQPVCAAILVIWFSPEKVNDPRSKAAYANGAFMLISRETYDRIGGHAAVRAELNEDMHMARLAKQRGKRLFVVENEGLYVTRMYASFAEAWRGWSRIFYGCFSSFRRLSLTLGVVLVMSVFPFVSLIVAALAFAAARDSNQGDWLCALLVCGLVVAVIESVMYRFMRIARAANWAWLTYPVGAVLGSGMLIAAIRKRGGASTTWRGTTYQADRPPAAGDDAGHDLLETAARPAGDVT